MNRLEQLRQQLADLKAEGLAIIELADAGDRDLTDDETEALEANEAERTKVQASIKSAEKLAKQRREMEARTVTRAPAGANMVNEANPALTGGFADIGEFARAVHGAVQATQHGGVVDERLTQLSMNATMQGGGSAGEGYSLPPQYRDAVWEIVQGFDEFGPLIDEEPTAHREVKLMADETTPWGTAGIKAYWRSEGAKMTETQLADEGRNVPLHELYALAAATEELLEDTPRLANRLTNKAGMAIAWKKNEAVVEGTGVGQPLGWTKGAAQVVIAKESGQTAGTIVAQNIAKMYARLQVVPGDTPFWMMNQDTLPQLMDMTIGDKPIWTPPNGFADAPGGFLLGRAIRFSEYADTLGTQNDIQLISPKGYYGVRRSAGIQFASSIHLYFDYAKQAFRWVFRYGGQPHLSAPITPNKGTATRSHFVTLATRA